VLTLLMFTAVGVLALTEKERLGKEIFFDNISEPGAQSCAECHAREAGWTGPVAGINLHGGVYRGAKPNRFGNRKPPSSGYATFSPLFRYDEDEGLFVGGNFWDGRATGYRLGNPAADQAGGPFLNPVEQNNPSKAVVCEKIAAAKYASLFDTVWGPGSLDCSPEGVDLTYDRIALSIAEYEASDEVNSFSSKFDAWVAGEAELTGLEMLGLELYTGKAMCSACHPADADPSTGKALFTDFTFDNLGLPKNPENPFYDMDEVYLDDGSPINPLGDEWIDPGLGGFLETTEWAGLAAGEYGKHKVPTLRNVDRRYGKGFPKSFGHNGYFKSLESIVHFYNTRDVKPECPDELTLEKDALATECWPAPEVAANVNSDELGDLGLTAAEEDALVAFLRTLSDGFDD
jgi:cytochrome c peroxidase